MGKTATYLIYFCIYSAVLLVIGKGSLRGDGTPRDYFICGRSVSLPLSVGTFTGTWVSAITILSLTGSVYEDGLAVLCYSVIPWFLGALLLGLVTRRLWDNDCITVPEFFRLRYDSRSLQAVYGLIFAVVYILYLVSQYKGFGMVASALFDIPYPAAVGMVYLFIMYTTFGGYRSVVRTDLFNLSLLVVILVLYCGFVLKQVGGLGSLYVQAAQISGFARTGILEPTKPGDLLSLFGGRYTPLSSLSMFWGWGLGLSANPQYIVRLLAAKDQRTAVRTVRCSLVVLAVIYFCLIHIGLGMRVLVPSLPGVETTDGIIIRLISSELYGPLSGLFLFSVVGACISTANSQLLMVASSLTYDVLRPLSLRPISDSRIVTLSRFAVVAGATLAMLLTLNPPDFTLSYGGDLWGIISTLLFPPLYATLLKKRVTRRGVWACIIAGLVSCMLFFPPYMRGQLTVQPAMFGVLISSTAMFLVSRWDRKREEGMTE